MAMDEWIEHYFWQGADLLILLDNNSTDGGAEIARKHQNVIVINAPKPFAQDENFFTLGYPCAIKNDVDVVANVDLDEFMFGQDGRPLKEHVVHYMNQGYSQISVHWTMFGSSGHIVQPKSIRKSFTWRKKNLQTNLKSIWKVSDIKEIKTHKAVVRGPTIELTAGIQINHYKIQSKEFYSKVKMKRGDAQMNNWNESRNWKTFHDNDFHDLEDSLLLNLLENRSSPPIPSEVEPYLGIMEHNPFDWRDHIPFLTVSLPLCILLLCFLSGFPLRVLSATLFVQAALLNKGNESNQIERNRRVGKLCFSVLALLSLFKT